MCVQRQVVLPPLIALLLVAVGAGALWAQVDQSTLANKLLGANARERSLALEQARLLGPPNIGPDLRRAMIGALEREDQIRVERYEADIRGEPVRPLEDPEFIAKVSHAVADLRDPAAIPALTGALGTGSPVTQALVAFGEQSVPALLAAARSPQTIHYVVDGALLTLRFLVEGKGPHPLSASSLNEIRQVAKQRLIEKQYFTTLWEAIDLGIALKDPGLRRVVQSIASDRANLVARGIDDSDTIADTQRRAAERLAGVPAKPITP